MRPGPNRSPFTAAAAVALLGALAPVVLAAQETRDGAADAAAAFGELMEVELVGVEVWVHGPDGLPVHGLTAADFQVRHDGRPVEITHFSELRFGVPAPEPAASEAPENGPAPAPVAAAPGHLVLYFDQLRLDPEGYRGVLDAVRGVLADRSLPAERVLVLRQDTGLHLEAPFGSSAVEIDAALERIAGSAHGGLAASAELRRAREAILDAWQEAESLSGSAGSGLSAASPGGGGPDAGAGSGPRAAVGGSGGGGGSILPSACEVFYQRAQPIVDALIRERGSRVSITLAHLTRTAGFLAGLPGVKTLLYVSDGLDVEPGAALASYVSDFCPTHGREHEMQSLAEGLTRDFRSLAGRFNAHRVTVHALQGSGLRGSGTGLASERGTAAPAGGRGRFEARQRQGERSGMSLLAEETGGRAVFNRNDFTDELAAIRRDMGSYYSLAYPPPPGEGTGGERREHRIEVELADRSLTARYRRGFRAPDPEEWMDQRLAGALHLGITGNPLGVRLGIGERPAGGAEPFRLYAMVPVDRLVFLPAEGGGIARIEVRGSVQSTGSGAPQPVGESFRVRRPPGVTDERVSLPLELELGPGAHRVAVGVRDLTSGEASFVTTSFEIDG